MMTPGRFFALVPGLPRCMHVHTTRKQTKRLGPGLSGSTVYTGILLSRLISFCLFSPLVELVDIMSKTAVPLDPVYTLKGVRGMLGELRDNRAAFSGNRILYIHTGECTVFCPPVHVITTQASLSVYM